MKIERMGVEMGVRLRQPACEGRKILVDELNEKTNCNPMFSPLPTRLLPTFSSFPLDAIKMKCLLACVYLNEICSLMEHVAFAAAITVLNLAVNCLICQP